MSLRTAMRTVRNVILGFVPNMEWFSAPLKRTLARDRARANGAMAELERCLAMRHAGAICRRFSL